MAHTNVATVMSVATAPKGGSTYPDGGTGTPMTMALRWPHDVLARNYLTTKRHLCVPAPPATRSTHRGGRGTPHLEPSVVLWLNASGPSMPRASGQWAASSCELETVCQHRPASAMTRQGSPRWGITVASPGSSARFVQSPGVARWQVTGESKRVSACPLDGFDLYTVCRATSSRLPLLLLNRHGVQSTPSLRRSRGQVRPFTKPRMGCGLSWKRNDPGPITRTGIASLGGVNVS
jgi:hypothetical protein